MEIPATTLFLAILAVLLFSWMTYKIGSYKKHLEWQKNLVKIRSDIAQRQRAGIKGRITESFAPYLPGFPFKASECKFIGDPIDFLVFEGLDERDVKGIHLVEVKNNKSKLSKHQKQIKEIIDNLDSNEVTFRTFNFSED